MQKTEDIEIRKPGTAFEEVELDRKCDARNLAAQLFDELHGRLHGSTGCQQIVHQQYALARLDGIEMNFQRVAAVFQVVADLGHFRGKLLWLADRDKIGR